jgi:uncharacterized repeat protein (TIGR04052 family)
MMVNVIKEVRTEMPPLIELDKIMKQKTGRFNLNFTKVMLSFVALVLFLSGCSEQKQAITFGVSFDGQGLKCEQMKFQSAGNWHIQTLRFFISEIQLKQAGKWYDVSYESGPWQTQSTALISLSAPNCDDLSQFNNKVEFSSEWAFEDSQGLRFKLGVPFELNHLDPLLQSSPLNIPDMFWSWQLGYKFLRLDTKGKGGGWSFHLGSIGCQSDSRMRSPKSPCRQPNLFEIELPASHSGAVILNLDMLLEQLELSQAASCMFNGSDLKSCEILLNNLQQQNLFVWQ